MVKNLPAVQEIWVQISWVGKIPWRRKWQPTLALLPGEFHGQTGMVSTVHGVTESDTTERLTFFPSIYYTERSITEQQLY